MRGLRVHTKTLYRPVGLQELALIYDMELRAFPPRLPDQPIFYPVTNRPYAAQIARDWNAPSVLADYAGFVTQFQVDATYVAKFPEQKVGGKEHTELWVPAEEVAEFNSYITEPISITDAFFGQSYTGFVPEQFGLRGKNAIGKFICLAGTLDYSGMDFICETSTNAKAIYLNAPFWSERSFLAEGISDELKARVPGAILKLWNERRPDTPFSVAGDLRGTAQL